MDRISRVFRSAEDEYLAVTVPYEGQLITAPSGLYELAKFGRPFRYFAVFDAKITELVNPFRVADDPFAEDGFSVLIESACDACPGLASELEVPNV